VLTLLPCSDGEVTERGCSTKNNICEDLESSETAYGFPVSRGCKTKEKISVKTRDCENRIEEGTFKRVCYCRRRLCNIGYDPLLELTGGVRYSYKPGVSAGISLPPSSLRLLMGLSWMVMCLLF